VQKLQKARTLLSVTVAGFTGSTIALISDQIVTSIKTITNVSEQVSTGNLEKNILLFFILVPTLYITHLLFNHFATWAFNIRWVRKLILQQDYVEGYWLVDNRIDDFVVSTGVMHYQIIDEQLKIEGTHFSLSEDNSEPKKIADSRSIAADCIKGDYFNHFDIPGVGCGVANGKFSSKSDGRNIPESFQVQVVIATSPASILEWGQNAPNWINDKVTGFSYLPTLERAELISSMATGRVVTMHQHGIRISKEEFNQAKEGNSKSYQRSLAKKHFEELQKEA